VRDRLKPDDVVDHPSVRKKKKTLSKGKSSGKGETTAAQWAIDKTEKKSGSGSRTRGAKKPGGHTKGSNSMRGSNQWGTGVV